MTSPASEVRISSPAVFRVAIDSWYGPAGGVLGGTYPNPDFSAYWAAYLASLSASSAAARTDIYSVMQASGVLRNDLNAEILARWLEDQSLSLSSAAARTDINALSLSTAAEQVQINYLLNNAAFNNASSTFTTLYTSSGTFGSRLNIPQYNGADPVSPQVGDIWLRTDIP